MEYILNERQLCDLELLLNGGFAPLNGYMNSKDYLSVSDNCTLDNGELWPIPIVLSIPVDQINQDCKSILLLDSYRRNVAELIIEEIYEPDIDMECLKVYGSNDDNHPYVSYLKSLGKVYYIGGKVQPKEGISHFDFASFRLSPYDTKEFVKTYDRVLGFQTRNPMHNCHYHLSKRALDSIHSSNKLLLLTPIVGKSQDGDIDYSIRVRCYIHILEKYKKDNIKVKLCLITLSMRMAGPREALWHALIRKNYGCTDFVIGRDHSGPSSKKKDGTSFYEPYEAHQFVNRYTNLLDINIILSENLVYDESIKSYVLEENCKEENKKSLSGTELRKRLRNREEIPDWFTLPEIAKELEISEGICIYLIGLSGSGKTTIANRLKERLLEKYRNITLLDGDIVRENLSQGLGFSKKDRSINVRRIGYVANLIVKNGGIVICSNIAPYDEDRLYNRSLISCNGKYIEIYVNTTLEICEERDVKGLYAKARSGQIRSFTGIDDPFETPTKADISITGEGNINHIIDQIMELT